MSQINPVMRKMVVFDMDNTLLRDKFIDVCAKRYNFKQALDLLRNIDNNSISFARRVASFLHGKSIDELEQIADNIPLKRGIEEEIAELKDRGYVIGIITDSYQVAADRISEKIGAHCCLSYQLEHINGIATGQVNIPQHFFYSEKSSCNHSVCKTNALRHLCEDYDVKLQNSIAIVGNDSDLCMIRHIIKNNVPAFQ